ARHTVEVCVTGADGVMSPWSEPLRLQSGFLTDKEWSAKFVGLVAPSGPATPGLARGEFEVGAEVEHATLYATAAGAYQVSINGVDVDEGVLKPGWTDYVDRLVHEATDVTDLVRQGRNAMGIRFAGAWWTEKYGFHEKARRVYGDQPSVAAQLHIAYVDGSVEDVATGPDWRAAAAGPLRSRRSYAGEEI